MITLWASYILVTLCIGAAWRRWFGSERPKWAKALDAKSPWAKLGGFPLRIGIQVPVGFLLALWVALKHSAPVLPAVAIAALAIGFMALPIRFSRRPFERPAEWLVDKEIVPSTYPSQMLNGWAPWSEVLQGATVFAAVTVAARIVSV